MAKRNINRIKAVLAEKNSSNKDIAKHLGRTESTVSLWCTNEIQPSLHTLIAIAEYLDVDIRDLLVSTKS